MTWTDGSEFQAAGLAPDVSIPLTIEDVRRKGLDRALADVQLDRIRAALTALGSPIDAGRVPQPPVPGKFAPRIPDS